MMTDEQLVNVIKLCSSESCTGGCEYDMNGKEYPHCMENLLKDALELIQRQQKTIEDMNDRIAYYDFDRICHNTVELNVILENYNVEQLKKRFRNEFENQMALGLEDCINWADWLDSIANEMWKEAKGVQNDY